MLLGRDLLCLANFGAPLKLDQDNNESWTTEGTRLCPDNANPSQTTSRHALCSKSSPALPPPPRSAGGIKSSRTCWPSGRPRSSNDFPPSSNATTRSAPIPDASPISNSSSAASPTNSKLNAELLVNAWFRLDPKTGKIDRPSYREIGEVLDEAMPLTDAKLSKVVVEDFRRALAREPTPDERTRLGWAAQQEHRNGRPRRRRAVDDRCHSLAPRSRLSEGSRRRRRGRTWPSRLRGR
jgi:hypothetical protein